MCVLNQVGDLERCPLRPGMRTKASGLLSAIYHAGCPLLATPGRLRRQGVRLLSWSKLTFEPQCRPLIQFFSFHPGQRTSTGSARDGKV